MSRPPIKTWGDSSYQGSYAASWIEDRGDGGWSHNGWWRCAVHGTGVLCGPLHSNQPGRSAARTLVNGSSYFTVA